MQGRGTMFLQVAPSLEPLFCRIFRCFRYVLWGKIGGRGAGSARVTGVRGSDWGVRQRRGVLAPIYHHYWGQQRSQGVRVESGMCKNHVLLFSSMISQYKDVIVGQTYA